MFTNAAKNGGSEKLFFWFIDTQIRLFGYDFHLVSRKPWCIWSDPYTWIWYLWIGTEGNFCFFATNIPDGQVTISVLTAVRKSDIYLITIRVYIIIFCF